MNKKRVMLFALPNSEQLGSKIAERLKMPMSKVNRTKFADGEVIMQAGETVREKDVFIVASTSSPVNDNIMELLLFIDSLKRASAHSITVVLTYYGYSRQDRKASGRQPIGAKLVADLLEKAGVSKMICIDLHNASIQGFFNVPLDDIKGQYILAPEIRKAGKFTVVSPDHGGAVRARVLAELISNSVDIAIIDKRRTGTNKAETMGILGNVANKNIVIIDDMIDTGGTIVKAAEILKKEGAKTIAVAATHGIFSKGFDKFDKSEAIDQVLITDSISSVYKIKSKKLKIVSLAEFLSETIKATIESTSISTVYSDHKNKITKAS